MLLVGPKRKARIKSYRAHALRDSPRRWSYVVPGPRGGAVRGITNSWADARDAVMRHIEAMYGGESNGGGRHRRPAGSSSAQRTGEAKGASHSFVSPSGRGRHAGGAVMGASVGPPPARDYALAALAGSAERPGYGALASGLTDRELFDPQAGVPLRAQVEEMRRSGAVR